MEQEADYGYFKLANLQARMDKCTNEQFWVVTTILAINAVFLNSDFIDKIEGGKGWLVITLLLWISIYGVWFVIKRHHSYYLYRGEFATIVKSIEEKVGVDKHSLLSKKPYKYSLNTLSGIIFYVTLIILATVTSLVFIIDSLLKSYLSHCCCCC
jgi:hypothetical protein